MVKNGVGKIHRSLIRGGRPWTLLNLMQEGVAGRPQDFVDTYPLELGLEEMERIKGLKTISTALLRLYKKGLCMRKAHYYGLTEEIIDTHIIQGTPNEVQEMLELVLAEGWITSFNLHQKLRKLKSWQIHKAWERIEQADVIRRARIFEQYYVYYRPDLEDQVDEIVQRAEAEDRKFFSRKKISGEAYQEYVKLILVQYLEETPPIVDVDIKRAFFRNQRIVIDGLLTISLFRHQKVPIQVALEVKNYVVSAQHVMSTILRHSKGFPANYVPMIVARGIRQNPQGKLSEKALSTARQYGCVIADAADVNFLFEELSTEGKKAVLARYSELLDGFAARSEHPLNVETEREQVKRLLLRYELLD